MAIYYVGGVAFDSVTDQKKKKRPLNDGRLYLAHHGIKGQKWGVRRFQNPDGTWTEAGKERYQRNRHGSFLNQNRDDDILIGKGTVAYRITSKKKERNSGSTFVTLSSRDHMEYIKAFKSSGLPIKGMTPDNAEKIKPYSAKFQVSNDLIAPSYRKTMEAFRKAVDKKGLYQVADIVENSKYTYSGREFVNDFKSYKVDELRDRAYINYFRSIIDNKHNRKDFIGELKRNGYNCVIDENDLSIASSPLYVFNRKRDLKKISVRDVDDKDVEFAIGMTQIPWEHTAKDIAEKQKTAERKRYFTEMGKKWEVY